MGKRTVLDWQIEILRDTQKGPVRITQLMVEVGIAHSVLKLLVTRFVATGSIQETKLTERISSYKITEKGTKILEAYDGLVAMLE